MIRKYIANKAFYKELLLIVGPIIIQFFIQNTINFLDNIMVGKLPFGDEAVASVSVANKYYTLFYAAVVSLCTGASIFTAQYFGSNQKERLKQVFGIKMIFSLIITMIFIIVGFIFSKEIIAFFISDSEAALDEGIAYLKIALWSYIPISISTAFTFTLRPLKMMKIPMVASSIGMFINLICNFFFIYGFWIFPAMGVQGAALATVIARLVEMSIYISIFLLKDYVFKASIWEYLKIDFHLLYHIVKKVIPLFFNEIFYTLAIIIIFKVYSDIGIGAINAISISDVVREVVFIIASGTGTATSILVGYKLGSNQLDEAEENANYLLGYSFIMGMIVMVIITGLAFIVPEFYNISETTKRLTTYAILIQGFVAPLVMLYRIPFFVLRAGGRVYEIVLLDGAFMWLVKVPVALILGYVVKADLMTIFLVVEMTRIINVYISMYFFKQKKWLINLSTQ